MTTVLPAAGAARAAPLPRSTLYRAIWRWHFFAGLVSVPFMVLLAVTGSLYLFHDEIEHTAFRYRSVVENPGTPPLAASVLLDRAAAAVPGTAPASFIEPASASASAVATVKGDAGKTRVYLDPYTGAVLDTVRSDREFAYLVKKIHSLELFGTFANRVIEAVAGFAMVLVVTGTYLWWPRGQAGGVLTVRATPKARLWWRDLHAVTGAAAGALIFFLAFTGMPWSGFWGEAVNGWADHSGLGRPRGMWDDKPRSATAMPGMDMDQPTVGATLGRVGWTVENAPLPTSRATLGTPISVDQAVADVRTLGMPDGFEMALPDGPSGVYTAGFFPDDLLGERMIHLDQYTGRPLLDAGYTDYGPIGKAVEYGISIHQGKRFGLANQLAMLATCVAIVLASVTALAMWWKRRPAGRVGVPPAPADARLYRGLWIATTVFGLAFPITGLAILVMLAIDLVLIRTVPPLRRAFA